MTALPSSYYIAVVLFVVLLLYGTLRLRAVWAFPYNAALLTVGAWYLIEPIYFPEQFVYFYPGHMETAFDGVVIYLVAFAIMTPVLVRQMEPKASALNLSTTYIRPERFLGLIAGLWLLLLGYGVLRLQGDLLGALFPLGGRSGAQMWGRAAGAGAGETGFIVSTASYLYILCLASFGVLLFFVRDSRYRYLLIALIVISWPYAFLQGSRSVTLAVIVPAAFCYLLVSRHSVLTKAIVFGLSFVIVDLAMRVVIQYRDIGFQDVDFSQVEGTTHLGLNMASELVYTVEFIDRGLLELSFGARYLTELMNVIPRALWPDKPLIGIEYAILRGFGGAATDTGVFATISTGVIGQGVQNFGTIVGPIVAALLMGTWVAILARLRAQGTPLRVSLFLIGLGLTFNLGRDITLLVLWPMIFGYLGVRLIEYRVGRSKPAAGRGKGGAPVRMPVSPSSRPGRVAEGP